MNEWENKLASFGFLKAGHVKNLRGEIGCMNGNARIADID